MAHLSGYLKTEAEPCLYYLPKKLTQDMEDVIDNQKKEALKARKTYEDKREARMEGTKGKEQPQQRIKKEKEDEDEEEEEEEEEEE
jgi:hypothetical protein